MNRMIKRITSIALASAVTVVSVCGGIHIQGVTPEEKKAQAAEKGGKYVRDLKVCYASDWREAQEKLGDEYTVIKRGVGIGKKTDTYIAYSTTDYPEDAIRDIKVEEMTGKHSVSEYERIQKEHQDAIKKQLDTFIPVLVEFTKNYDADLPAAKIIAMHLNYYYEDDSDEALGDYLLKQGRALGADGQNADVRQALEKLYIEGNSLLVQSMEDMITQGSDTKIKEKGSWLTRMSELGPKGLIKEYKLAYPNLKTDKAVLKQISKDYGEEAKAILNELSEVQSYLREGESSDLVQAVEEGDSSKAGELLSEEKNREIDDELTNDMTVEDIAESLGEAVAAVPDTMDAVGQASLAALTVILKGMSYGDQTMYDFFMREDLTADDLYPMAYVLSDGQKTIMEDIGLVGIFHSASAEYTEETDDLDTMQEEIGEKVYSVYEGVDREMFKGDTALTEDALSRMAATDDNEALTNGAGRGNYIAAIVSATIGGMCLLNLDLYWRHMVKTKTVLIDSTTTEAYREATVLVENAKKELALVQKSERALHLKAIEKYQYLKGYKANLLASTEQMTKEYRRVLRVMADPVTGTGNLGKVAFLSKESQRAIVADQIAKVDDALVKQNAAKMAKNYKQVKVPMYGARIALVLGAVASFAFAGYELYQILKPAPGVDFTEIPATMVSRTYDESDEISYVSYSVVRTPDGKKADIHNWEGQQWVALYTTSDEQAGEPILASGLQATFRDTTDADSVPVTEFCYNDAFNLVGGNDSTTYLFFKRGMDDVTVEVEEATETEEPPSEVVSGSAAETETASVFGFSSIIWIILLVVVVIGAGIGTAVTIRKRKKTK